MESKKKHIVCIHLLNNYSGSPKVLMQVILGLIDKGYTIDLITNRSSGFLSDLAGVKYRYIFYQWNRNKFITLFNFILAQIQIFFFIYRDYRNKNITIYINTLLPVGAAFIGKLTKKEIIYHVHEKYIKNTLLHQLYLYAYKQCANKVVFVSNYLKMEYDNTKDITVVYNALDNEFIQLAGNYIANRKKNPKTILFISSQKYYKGIYQFLTLSKLMPNYSFEMILSNTPQEISDFTYQNNIPINLKIYSTQHNLHPFYQRARILLNLSITDLCVESFGLTILEAMTYGIPTIVPPVGGPIELVEDGFNGFLVDSRRIEELQEKIDLLMTDELQYNLLSNNALLKSKQFKYNLFIDKIESIICK